MSVLEVEALENLIEAMKAELGQKDVAIDALRTQLANHGKEIEQMRTELIESELVAGKALMEQREQIRELKETIVQQAIQKQSSGPQVPASPKQMMGMLGQMISGMEKDLEERGNA